jgi:hypothetical protein
MKKRLNTLSFYRDTSLLLAMFFLPFGYDALFKVLMELTDSYWIADGIFYLISIFFWIMYIVINNKLNKTNGLNQ